MQSAFKAAGTAVRLAKVSVIVRSTGDRSRTALLKRAVTSILTQSDIDLECIVVFNGYYLDEQLVEWTQGLDRTRTVVLNRPAKADATLIGRALVRGDFFCYLDDDDQFLPGALAFSANYLAEHPKLDCVATNGYYVCGERVRAVFSKCERFERDGYVGSLLTSRNWLASCGGMFRTSRVSSRYFANLTRHREWTLIAYRIACDLNVEFVNRLSYRIYSVNGSQSKTSTYVDAGTEVIDAMLEHTQNKTHAHVLRRRRSHAFRAAASYYRMRRNFPRAWEAFREAVRGEGGWRYVPYAALLLAHESRSFAAILRNERTHPCLKLQWRIKALLGTRASHGYGETHWRVLAVATRPIAAYCLENNAAKLCGLQNTFSETERNMLHAYCERNALNLAELIVARDAAGELQVIASSTQLSVPPNTLPIGERLKLIRRVAQSLHNEFVAPIRQRRRFAKDLCRWLRSSNA